MPAVGGDRAASAAQIDVLFGAAALTNAVLAGRVVAVIDVLRASTTIATALARGARSVVPLATPDAVVERGRAFARAEVRLAGELRMRAVPGFDFGNSPLEFTAEAVGGRTVLLATTNGTPALVAAQNAREAVVAAYVNYSAVLAYLRSAMRGGASVVIVCAGQDRQFALEDAACAGRYVRALVRRRPHAQINDAARTCALLDRRYGERLDLLFMEAAHGRALSEAGYADDLAYCAQLDTVPVVPVMVERQLVPLGGALVP